MKKILSIFLSIIMIFGSVACVSVFAENDVNVNMGDFFGNDDPFAPKINVSLEESKDAGYIQTGDNNYSYTAVPYFGNEFLGWYNKADDSLVSADATVTLTDGDYVAKFEDNNVLSAPNGGFELGTLSENLIGSSWNMVASDTWRNIYVTNQYAKSGKNSLAFKTRYQGDIYTNLNALETNTYYIVSYYWMLPKSVITDTSTSRDGYKGAIVTTTDVNDIETARNSQNLGGDYVSKNISFVGGQWNKTEFVFYTGDNTDLRMFITYDSEASGNEIMYVDELTVYKPENQQEIATYKVDVTNENCYAFASHNTGVSYETEVWVTATPFTGEYVFDGWYEDGVKVSDEQTFKFNITANRNLVAKAIPATSITLDINKDSEINLKDLVALAQHTAGWSVDINKVSADVNASGNIALTDVTLLAQNLAGWDVADKLAANKLALPTENLSDENLATTLLAGESEYFNKSAVINRGNNARIVEVLKKAQRGENITIVGFGGSITQGTGATSVNNRYGDRVAAWFRAQFPDITVNYVNAGIGSTTSLVGVNRIAEDVLAHNPDFVIVDFAANDQPGDNLYQHTFEAVVRRLLEADAAVLSVVFGPVSAYDANNGEGKNLRSSNSIKEHLPTLTYYDIPTIDYYGALWRYLNAGVINWTQVGNDYIHPNNNGHLMAASAINAYLADILENIDVIDTVESAIPAEYFDSDVYKNASFLKSSPTENTNFTAGDVHGGKINGWLCGASGGTITFTATNATSVSVFLQSKVGNSTASIYVNGEKVVTNTDCSSTTTNGFIWIKYNKVFDEAQDITVTVEANGTLGVAPIGVTYAE